MGELERLVEEQAEERARGARALPETIGGKWVDNGFQEWASYEDGLESGDNGYAVLHKVVATVPWQQSLVRLGQRPRVAPATRNRTCEGCGFEFQGTTQSRYCRGEECDRARAVERKRLSRSQAGSR